MEKGHRQTLGWKQRLDWCSLKMEEEAMNQPIQHLQVEKRKQILLEPPEGSAAPSDLF